MSDGASGEAMSFPIVALEEVVNHRNQFIQINDLENYKRCRVQLHAQGIVLRDVVPGSEIKTKKQQVCRPGEFLVAEIDAKIGGFGIVPPELDGAIVSSHYFLFVIDETRLNRQFLDYFIRTPYFREQITAQGSTNYAAIRPTNVLSYKIPLPPLSEQCRIVARIEELAAKIEEARGLRRKAVGEDEVIISSATSKICYGNGQILCSFGEVLLEAKNGIYKPPEYWGFGIPCVRMYNIKGHQMNTNQLQNLDVTPEELKIYSCKPGDLIFNRVNSAELVGKTGLITENYPNCTFESKNMRLRVDIKKTLPEYAVRILNSKETREYYRLALKQQCGMATLNQGHVRSIPFPLLPLPEQRRIVAYLDELQAKVDALRRLQAETGTELDALMPAVLDRAFKGEL
jgi:type I restriction enzyme S subunit